MSFASVLYWMLRPREMIHELLFQQSAIINSCFKLFVKWFLANKKRHSKLKSNGRVNSVEINSIRVLVFFVNCNWSLTSKIVIWNCKWFFLHAICCLRNDDDERQSWIMEVLESNLLLWEKKKRFLSCFWYNRPRIMMSLSISKCVVRFNL